MHDISGANLTLYHALIISARDGNRTAEGLLRLFLHDVSASMPVAALLEVSETLLAFRVEERRRDIRAN